VAADFFETCVDILKLIVGDFVLHWASFNLVPEYKQ
jgi:hypothetical protein